MDFRANAAEMTFRRTQDPSGAALAQLDESGCLEISGGRRTHCLFEIPFVIFSLLFLLAILVIFVLNTFRILPLPWTLGVSTGLLIVNLFSRKIKSLLLHSFLRVRTGSLLQVLKDLPTVDVGLENGATHKQIKMVVEDEGVCLLDAPQKRILMEGCSYRYIIYARDISSIEPVSQYALSGARLICRIAGSNLDIVLTVRGHGPIASLIQTFSPSSGAQSLAAKLTQTLFGADTPSYAKPPPFPSERR